MISSEIRELIETGSAIRKMFEEGCRLKQIHGAENVADLTLGNPIAPPPPALLAALAEVVAHPPNGLHRYTPNAGHPEVRERVAGHLDDSRLLPGASRQHVVMTAGAAAGCNVVLRAILEPGDEVILLAPYFPDYPAHVLNHRGVQVVAATGPDFLPDPQVVEQAAGPRTRALIINTPNNPSGRFYPESLLHQLVEVLQQQSRRNQRPVYLISDEPYREICYVNRQFVSPARLYEHGIMVYSFSKSMSLAGERIGYVAINPESPDAGLLETAFTLTNRALGFVNAPSLWQHVVARCLGEVVDQVRLGRNRRRLLDALTDKGYSVSPPDGGFYMFPGVPDGDDDALVRETLKRLLLVGPGATFGYPGHFRMAFCVDEHTIDLAIERLPLALKE
jgi:aspartate aminotransferase